MSDLLEVSRHDKKNCPWAGKSGFSLRLVCQLLIDDLDDLPRSRINQYGVVIHVRISITLDVILARNVVISHSIGR